MSKVRALKVEFVSPVIVMESVASKLETLKDLYVIGINADGEPEMWATGDLSNMCFASMALQQLCHQYLRGELEDE